MSRQPRGSHPPASARRQNEYFVSRDGIDREVISADICRYLGNDALVRPGHYEDPHTRQTVHGYYITAYRNLTSAMIEDLKADSARWDTERRTQSSRNTSGGSFASRDAGYSARMSSNSPVVQYRSSETHHSRQHLGPSNEGSGYAHAQDSYGREPQYADGPRYPGTGTAGYTGASGPYGQGYGGGGGGGVGVGGGAYDYQQQPPPQSQQQQHPRPPQQQSPQPDPRYSGYGQPPMDRGYATAQDGPTGYVHTGAHRVPPPSRGYNDDGYSHYPPNAHMVSSAAAPTQPIYASAPPPQQAYPAPASPYSGQVPSATSPFSSMHGGGADNTFGRGQSIAPPTGFPGQGQQFGDAPNPRSSVPPPTAAAPTTTATKRRSDRDDDRHTPSDRQSRQPRR